MATISSLPTGAKIKLGRLNYDGSSLTRDIVWTLVSKSMGSQTGYPSNCATLHSTYVLTELVYDVNGISTYLTSSLHEWLNNTGYDYNYSRPGFLYNFTQAERNILQQGTTIPQVYIPRFREIGNNATNEGYNTTGLWGYYRTNTDRLAYDESGWMATSWTSDVVSSGGVLYYYTQELTGTGLLAEALLGNISTLKNGVRPAIHIPLSTKISSTTDSDGCYTVDFNTAPTAPSYIEVPQTVIRGVPFTVSWGEATDPDGSIKEYILHREYDGSGTWVSAYRGLNRTYVETAITQSEAASSVKYRIYARDNSDKLSPVTESSSANIITNTSPVISGSDGSLGTKSAAFTQTYAVSDADFDEVTVVERIDGEQIRSYTATLGATNTFSVTGETWLKLLNGSHSMTITATDANTGTATRTYSFVKSVTSFTIQNATPFSSADMPTRIKLYITRSIPTGAIFTAHVCNNGYDATPTWEDVTDRIDSNEIYEFTNDTKTASNWGVSIKVEVSRNGAQGECYVSAIGGNFDSN